MIFQTKMPYEVPNDVIMQHQKRIKFNILISACTPNANSHSSFSSFPTLSYFILAHVRSLNAEFNA